MSGSHCLNCETPLFGKYCHECGQKADTHRITAKHFIQHDLIHGVWHIDKGIPYTLKQALTRPGFAAKDYIKGRRVKFYNIFYLLLMALALALYIDAIKNGYNSQAFATKATYLTFVPLYAVAGIMLFKRIKYNFFEHLIIGGMTELCLVLVIIIINFIELWPFDGRAYVVQSLNYLQLLIPVIVYYQATKNHYKFLGFAWRVVLLQLFVMTTQFVLVQSYLYLVYMLK